MYWDLVDISSEIITPFPSSYFKEIHNVLYKLNISSFSCLPSFITIAASQAVCPFKFLFAPLCLNLLLDGLKCCCLAFALVLLGLDFKHLCAEILCSILAGFREGCGL